MDHNRPKYVYFFCLLDMFGFAPKCMGEGGGKVTQTILGRKNVPSLKKPKMSQFCYVPEYLRPKILRPRILTITVYNNNQKQPKKRIRNAGKNRHREKQR